METNQYVIISKTSIQKRIEELEKLYQDSEKPSIQGTIYNKLITELKQFLSQSTPLIPEIKKAFEAGKDYEFDCQTTLQKTGMSDGTSEYPNTKDYISNLKLDI